MEGLSAKCCPFAASVSRVCQCCEGGRMQGLSAKCCPFAASVSRVCAVRVVGWRD